MKIKTCSLILAGAYSLCGAMFFLIVAKYRILFSESGVPLPFLTRAVLAIGPLGWLCLAVSAGAVTILKDLRFRSPLLNLVLTLVLGLLATCITVAVFLPAFPPQQIGRLMPSLRVYESGSGLDSLLGGTWSGGSGAKPRECLPKGKTADAANLSGV